MFDLVLTPAKANLHPTSSKVAPKVAESQIIQYDPGISGYSRLSPEIGDMSS